MSQTVSSRHRFRVPVPTPSVRAGAGEPLLLVHPFLTSHDVWADVVPTLAEEFDVLAVTLPGHWGGPALRRRDVSLAAFADGLEAALDDAGWDTCHVAGNSIGGWLALELARRGRARSVTAIAPAGGWRRLSTAQLRVGLKFLAIAPLALVGRLSGDLGRHLAPARAMALRIVAARRRSVSRERADNFLRAASNCSAFLPYVWSDLRRGGITGLDRVDVPVRLVLCEEDWLLPPDPYGVPFVRELGGADVVRVPGVGHVPMLEAPDQVARLVAEHARAHPEPVSHADIA